MYVMPYAFRFLPYAYRYLPYAFCFGLIPHTPFLVVQYLQVIDLHHLL